MSGRLVYRPVVYGERAWAAWTEDLYGRSGVYVIRSKRSHETLYVGESHSGRLHTTFKRHFWRWRDDYTRKHHVYPTGTVEAAVRFTAPSRAFATQNVLIRRLNPRDNGNGWDEDIPF